MPPTSDLCVYDEAVDSDGVVMPVTPLQEKKKKFRAPRSESFNEYVRQQGGDKSQVENAAAWRSMGKSEKLAYRCDANKRADQATAQDVQTVDADSLTDANVEKSLPVFAEAYGRMDGDVDNPLDAFADAYNPIHVLVGAHSDDALWNTEEHAPPVEQFVDLSEADLLMSESDLRFLDANDDNSWMNVVSPQTVMTPDSPKESESGLPLLVPRRGVCTHHSDWYAVTV